MNRRHEYLFAPVLFASLLAAGCAGHAAKPAVSTDSTTQVRAATAITGIPACDEYLAHYKPDHRAADIYRPDTIQAHYTQMRHILLSEAHDPTQRPALAARCVSMTRLLRQVLHDKSHQQAQRATAPSAP